MARFEIQEVELSSMGQQNISGDVFFQLGMSYSTGRGVEPSLVAAHKWFNLAAARGNSDAVRYRREVSEQMSSHEVAEAQRQAREWLTRH